MRHIALITTLWGVLALQVPAAQAAGDDLWLGSPHDPWSLWQSRVSGLSSIPTNSTLGLGRHLPLGSARWSGDHFFSWGKFTDGGGLRATGALLWPAAVQQPDSAHFASPWWRQTPQSSVALTSTEPDTSSSPAAYVGLGYSAYWAKTGIGLSADLGLVSQRPYQLLQANRSNESLWRSLQVSPMLQVNLSYAF